MNKYNVLVKIDMAGGSSKWVAVSPTYGQPYEFSKKDAEKYIETYDKGNGRLKLKEIQ